MMGYLFIYFRNSGIENWDRRFGLFGKGIIYRNLSKLIPFNFRNITKC